MPHVCEKHQTREMDKVCLYTLKEKVAKFWRVNVDMDNPDVHPQKLCGKCYTKATGHRYLDGTFSVGGECASWMPHSDSCNVCSSGRGSNSTRPGLGHTYAPGARELY